MLLLWDVGEKVGLSSRNIKRSDETRAAGHELGEANVAAVAL